MKRVESKDCKFKDTYGFLRRNHKVRDLEKLVDALNEIVGLTNKFVLKVIELGDEEVKKFDKVFKSEKYECHRGYMMGFAGQLGDDVGKIRDTAKNYAEEFVQKVRDDETEEIEVKLVKIAKFKEGYIKFIDELYKGCKEKFHEICTEASVKSIQKNNVINLHS